MSIGEDLAQARRQAGLTVAQVSQQTRIRETIIREIEQDQYSGCGGDFYARGHIRSIARAVGTDPEPLIRAYDAARPPAPGKAAGLPSPITPIEFRRRHRGHWAAVLGLVLIAGLAAGGYSLFALRHHAPPHHPPRAAAQAAAQPGTAGGQHAAAAAAPTTPAAAPASPQPYAGRVAVHLVAVQDCWVQFTTPGGAFLFQAYVSGGTVRDWTFRHPVDMQLGNPAGVRLTVDGRHPLPPGTASPITLKLSLGSTLSR